MVTRTFFDKNNTIVKNSIVNTGQNPITELFYGGPDKNYSRFLMYFNLDTLKTLVQDKTFADVNKLKHTLKITNTSLFDKDLLNGVTCSGKDRASSFDLILFRIEQEWDEGVGYDYSKGTLIGTTSICTEPSNWKYSQSNVEWINSGGGLSYSGQTILSATTSTLPKIISTQHFDHGNENIEMDLSETINTFLTGNTETNYGFGLAYKQDFENKETNNEQHVGFFTRHTQTFFEPHLESNYCNTIIDDRHDFYLNKDNKVYLYSNIGGKPTNLDELPTVSIKDENEQVILTATTTQITKGVYCAELNISSSPEIQDCTQLYDTWENIKLKGKVLPNSELTIIVKNKGYFNIGDSDDLPKQYGFNIHGINQEEKVNRGDLRKLIVSARIPYTVEQNQLLDDLKYRLYTKEGTGEYTVIDYQDVHRTTNTNYFLLDTKTLVPGEYYIDLKVISNLETRVIKETLNFHIVNTIKFK